jgi:nucleotide-binding universal stress UspA family protein
MKRILVGLDASPRSDGVLHAAAELARHTGATLILFRAIGVPHEIPVEAYTMTPVSLVELLEREAKDYLARVAASVPKGIAVETAIHVGTPWQGVCDAAVQHHADCIIIGSHGYSGLDHLLGTTAAKVVNHAKVSVLVVRGSVELTA